MFNLKNLILFFSLASVLKCTHTYAGGNEQNKIYIDDTSVGFEKVHTDQFFPSIPLMGYSGVLIVNDLSSPIDVKLFSKNGLVTEKILRIPSGSCTEVFLPGNTRFVLKAIRTTNSAASVFETMTPALRTRMVTRLSNWTMRKPTPTVPTTLQPRRLFDEQDEQNGIDQVDNDDMFAD